MLKILKKESGNLTIVMLMAVLGMTSGLAMSGMVLRDFRNYATEYEQMQGRHILRSDAYRGQNYLVKNPIALHQVRALPEKTRGIDSGRLKRTFRLRSLVEKTQESTIIGSDHGLQGTTMSDAFKIKSLVNTAVGSAYGSFDDNSTQVYEGAVLTLNQSSLAEFMYFSDQDTSPAGKPVYFYGKDVIEGKIHSNSDIYMKQAGGGSNNGWPTFLNLVTTTGHIISSPASYPLEQVFQGGLIEEYEGYDFPATAETLRRNARKRIGNDTGGADKDVIYMVEVDGGTAYVNKGEISDPRRAFADVWNPYPPLPVDEADSLYLNNFSIKDTTWTTGVYSGMSNNGIMVFGDLWIKGEFAGYQTWGCSRDIYLIGDIKLRGTELNTFPTNNRNDMVGLVSEGSIYVKYAYKDPIDSIRYHPNVGADADVNPEPAGGGIFIYAAMAALGDGGYVNPDVPNFQHGVFTFEYQHPHGSTPAVEVTFEDSLYYFDWIDLHRRRYPPTQSEPWPGGLDYPWYNPVWPERNPYTERGTINIFGAVAQRRRGFVHRSGNDNEYPSNSGVWNIPLDMCGGPVTTMAIPDPVIGGLVLQARQYPGTSGSGVGYRKNYNFDRRFLESQPLYYPEARLAGGKEALTHGAWSVEVPDLGEFNRYF
jgi:hypothetical protein